MRKPEITVLSTFAKDKIFDKDLSLIREQKGGPAFYIQKAFNDEDVDFDLITGPPLEVEILVNKKGEFGRIKNNCLPQSIDFSAINTPYLLISTIQNDFNLKGIEFFRGKVFLDIQGYVRDGSSFGKKKYWKTPERVASSVFCLKGTKKEISYLLPAFISMQKDKIMLVTKGKNGCDLYLSNKQYSFAPFSVVRDKEAIGAGDSLFAYFISRFIKTQDQLASVKYAIEKTSTFLKYKDNLLSTGFLFNKG